MTRIRVHSELHYDVEAPSQFVFAMLAAENQRQHVDDQHFAITPDTRVERIRFDPSGHDLVRASVEPGPLSVAYEATVDVRPHIPIDVPQPRDAVRRDPR